MGEFSARHAQIVRNAEGYAREWTAAHHRLRVALVGDRLQLAAVGPGGVLDLAVAYIDADAYLTLGGVHRSTRLGETGRRSPTPHTPT